MTNVFGQSQYQVRFDWGIDGARAIADGADVVVVVDVLSLGDPVDVVPAPLPEGSRIAAALSEGGAIVVAGSLRNPTAVARWVLAQQGDRGDRFTVAVIAAGERRGGDSLRFALEDQLGAGAIIDALAEIGIDYCSPEAAAAAASFTGLRNATGHLIGASASGRVLAEAGRRMEIERAIEVDASDTVPVLREFGFPVER